MARGGNGMEVVGWGGGMGERCWRVGYELQKICGAGSREREDSFDLFCGKKKASQLLICEVPLLYHI